MSTREQQHAAMLAELRRQDEELARAMETLRSLGPAEIAVPVEMLEAFDTVTSVNTINQEPMLSAIRV